MPDCKTNYQDILKRKAAEAAVDIEHPEHKALDHVQLENKRRINAWREKYARQAQP